MKISCVFCSFFLCIQIFGQRSITGKVIDQRDQTPIDGAMVISDPTQYVGFTDDAGNFTLNVNSDTLRIVALGYETLTLEMDSSESYIVLMNPLSFVFEQTIEVLGRKNLSTLNSYAKLDASLLNLGPSISLADPLNTVPGVFMHSGALNTNRITIRGIGNRSLFATTKIRAFLADIPLTSGIGESTIEDIDFHFIKSMEVFKGPIASRNGAALGGLIQLTPNFNLYQGRSDFKIFSTIGSFGQLHSGEYLTIKKPDPGIGLQLGHSFLHSSGYRENNEYNRNNITGLLQWVKEKHQIYLLGSFISLKAFIPSSLSLDDYQNNPKAAALNWSSVMGFEDYDKFLFGFSYKHQLTEGLRSALSLYINSRNAYESRPFNILSEDSFAKGGRLIFEWEKPFSTFFDIHMGVDYFHEDYDWMTFETQLGNQGELLSDNIEDRRITNYFFEQSMEFAGHWRTELGINLNITEYDLKDNFNLDGIDFSGIYKFDAILSPKIGISYSPEINQTYFLNISHGFSAPTLEETLTPEGQINPEIQPERGWNYEIGLKLKLFDQRFSTQFSIYRMVIKDLLVARRTDFDQFTGVNAGKTRHDGIEFQSHIDVIKQKYQLLRFIINYQYSNYIFKEFLDLDQDYSGNQLTGTAAHLFNAIFQYSYGKLFANLQYKFVDEMPLRDDNSEYSDAYSLLNFKLGIQFVLTNGGTLELNGAINNLTNTKYASMFMINALSFGNSPPRYYYPGLPRNAYLSASYHHQF